LPYRHRDRVTWIPADDHKEVLVERGGSVEGAESGSAPRQDRPFERACERRSGKTPAQRDAPERVTSQRDAPEEPRRSAPKMENLSPCCGERWPGRAGEPLVLACQLCPKSPTYHRRDELDRQGA
jgi:hypothetical protein